MWRSLLNSLIISVHFFSKDTCTTLSAAWLSPTVLLKFGQWLGSLSISEEISTPKQDIWIYLSEDVLVSFITETLLLTSQRLAESHQSCEELEQKLCQSNSSNDNTDRDEEIRLLEQALEEIRTELNARGGSDQDDILVYHLFKNLFLSLQGD